VTRAARCAAVLFAWAGAVWAVDRLTKIWVEASLDGRPPLTIVPGVLDLRFTTNSGGAFSVGRSAPWLFAGASIAVSAAIVATAWRHTSAPVAAALGAILGGAIGNLTDRIVRGPRLTGHVIDFIDFRVWPVFNLADTAIVVGAIALAASSWLVDRDGPPGAPSGRAEPSARDEA
jgi:signal peptidase II